MLEILGKQLVVVPFALPTHQTGPNRIMSLGRRLLSGVPHDVGMDVRERFVNLEEQEPAHDFHVLLRHRLLPQPHGFEGLVSGLVDGHPRDLSVADLGDPSRPGPNRKPARPSRVNDSDWNDNAVASVDEVIRLRPYVAPSLGQHREVVPNPLVPAVAAPAQGAPRRVDYSIWSRPGDHAFDIASRDRREQPFDDLHAFLRHRPPSIPCGGRGRWRREMSEPADRRMGGCARLETSPFGYRVSYR